MRALTQEEISKFASRKDVKKIAVENFLGTVHHNPNSYAAYNNLISDAGSYKWNNATVLAIREGIRLVEFT